MDRGVRGTVPVVLNIVEVQLDDRPQVLSDPRGVAILNQPVSVKDESSGSQSWTIPLGSTYVYFKSINVGSRRNV